MKKFGQALKLHWKTSGLVAVVLLFVGLLLVYRLGSLVGGLSPQEASQQAFSSSWHNIVHNPLNAPLTVLQWIALTLSPHHGQTITRLPSSVFGILTLLAFAYILRHWYGLRTAVAGTVLFMCSSWFLHVSRLATPDILYLWAIPTLLAAQLLWQRHASRYGSFWAAAVAGLLLYIPGIVWPFLVVLLLQPQLIISGWRRLERWWLRTALALFCLLLLLPLAYAMWCTPTLFQSWLGLPHAFESGIHIVKRLIDSITFFVYRGPLMPMLWLDKVPILDIFAVVMLLLGGIFYGRHYRLLRTRLLLGLFLVGSILFALGGPVVFSLLVPLGYFVVAAGVGYLLHEWLHVFPRNPLARSIGFGLLSAAIILSCAYNLRAYFVAWPHSRPTISTFSQHR